MTMKNYKIGIRGLKILFLYYIFLKMIECATILTMP